MKRPTFIGLALASLLALNACSPQTKKEADATKTTPAASAPKTLRFSAIPNQNSTELKAKFDPMAAHLSAYRSSLWRARITRPPSICSKTARFNWRGLGA